MLRERTAELVGTIPVNTFLVFSCSRDPPRCHLSLGNVSGACLTPARSSHETQYQGTRQLPRTAFF
jgi:hypothetical protein